MNTKTPLFIVISIGVAVAIVQGSGAINIWGMAGPADNMESAEELQKQSADHSLQQGEGDGGSGLQGQVNPESDSDIVGVILGTLPKMIGLLAIPGLLSAEMMNLGLWPWVAGPLGLLGNLVTYVGGFQLVTNRMYE